jgi:hypothetical protein
MKDLPEINTDDLETLLKDPPMLAMPEPGTRDGISVKEEAREVNAI